MSKRRFSNFELVIWKRYQFTNSGSCSCNQEGGGKLRFMSLSCRRKQRSRQNLNTWSASETCTFGNWRESTMKTTLSTRLPAAVNIMQVHTNELLTNLKPSCPADLKTTPRWMTDICYYIYSEEEASVKFLRLAFFKIFVSFHSACASTLLHLTSFFCREVTVMIVFCCFFLGFWFDRAEVCGH